jgi:lysophospholipase L1-like esterase
MSQPRRLVAVPSLSASGDPRGTSGDPRVRVGPLGEVSRAGARGPWDMILGRKRVLVLADSLAFHGPHRLELLTEPRLWPNVLARELPAEVEVVGRMGWTARDVWWALTRDPHLYSILLPRADVVILAVGGMDYLPALVPTYLREGIPYLRPDWLRRGVRLAYRAAQPWGARVHNGRWRNLPQPLTDDYLSRSVAGIRYFHPTAVIAGMLPPPHNSSLYGRVTSGHAPAVAAARAWATREKVPMLDAPALVGPELSAGRCNVDGLHWSWAAHDAVGRAYADLLRPLLGTAR